MNVGTCTETILSLCSGIGGLDLGLRLAMPNVRTICYVEGEAFCINHLVKKMEEATLDSAPVWTDVKTFNGKAWHGKVSGIIGGYPCQPFSIAGKQLGEADPRHLWPDIRRIVQEVQPQWCFFENVANHLRLGFEQVRDDLRAMDYTVKAGLFTAAEVGAPHKRQRLFILAYASGARQAQRECQESGEIRDETRGEESDRRCGPMDNSLPGRHRNQEEEIRSRGYGTFPPGPADTEAWAYVLERWPELAPALADNKSRKQSEQQEGDHGGTPEASQQERSITRTGGGGDSRDTTEGVERTGRTTEAVEKVADTKNREGRQAGIPPQERNGKGQEVEPAVRGMAHGIPNRVDCLRALGNAVIPIVAAKAFITLAGAQA